MDTNHLSGTNSVPIRASDIKEFMYQLRLIARSLLAGERNAHSVAPTMLVHSAYYRNTIKDHEWTNVTWECREHFFADMVRAMRRSLIDRVRRSRAAKRPKLEFFSPEDMPVDFAADLERKPERVELLEEALQALEQDRPELARVIHFHYYIGLTTHEIAELLEVSEKTVDRHLLKARVLLAEKMESITSRPVQN
jgi:RNA polymerase sigma factor (TIGR02999 family)